MADDHNDGSRPRAAIVTASAGVLGLVLLYVFLTYGPVAGFSLWGMATLIWIILIYLL